MTLLFCGRWSNIPRYLPRTTRAASLLCILMRTAPFEPCDTAAIAAAVFSSWNLGRRPALAGHA